MIFLIAEDNRRMRETIRRFLETRIPNHHTIHEAADGKEAVDMFEVVKPEFVIMDIEMEPMDGLAASRAIVAAHPEAKIIILTNYDEPHYRATAKEAGAWAFVLKEHLSDLLSIFSPYLERGQS
jgi:DNA-binding NarL/FixJ family response regulator